ncbi:hypothetical protein PoB_002801400, partial [Plakobranchus ocellatus]
LASVLHLQELVTLPHIQLQLQVTVTNVTASDSATPSATCDIATSDSSTHVTASDSATPSATCGIATSDSSTHVTVSVGPHWRRRDLSWLT